VCCHAAGLSLAVCSACNLASPVISGILFEILTGRQPMSRYPPFLAALAAIYIIEPLLTRVYIRNACTAGEKARFVSKCRFACMPWPSTPHLPWTLQGFLALRIYRHAVKKEACCAESAHTCMQVLRLMRQELFRVLLMGRIEFFDRHSTAALTQLLSVELDALRSLVFGNVSRDRGARAVLEAVGSVLVRARGCQIRLCSPLHACMHICAQTPWAGSAEAL
jgi:ATP-binding cassette subfamily B (MDR/TAP) protein 8